MKIYGRKDIKMEKREKRILQLNNREKNTR